MIQIAHCRSRHVLPKIVVAALISCAFSTVHARTWTTPNGKKFEAIFLGKEGDQYRFRSAQGKEGLLPATNFVAADREAAERFAKIGDDSYTIASARKIDRLLAQNLKSAGFTSFNAPLSDELFVRRVYLDIIGRIATREEFQNFIEDSRPDKRQILIDELLLSPGYASHLYNYFADMYRLRVDALGGSVYFEPYFQWWREQIQSNQPYDKIVYQMITAKGNLGQNPASGFLLRDRGMEIDAFSNFAQTLLGIDLSCAQCHDHPFEDWTQADFYSMAAFFGNTHRSGRNIGNDQFGRIGTLPNAPENWLRDFLQYAEDREKGSVKKEKATGPLGYYVGALTSGISDTELLDLKYPHDYKGDEGEPGALVSPRTILGNRATPQAGQTRREAMAEWMLSPENPRFALTIANRMWNRAFGKPLVGPVNDVTEVALNGASQPEVVKFVTSEMQRVDYDLREFMRILYNTRAYQTLSTADEPDLGGRYAFQGPVLRRMTAEQAWDSLMLLEYGPSIDTKTGYDGSFHKTVIDVDPETMSFDDVWERFVAFRDTKAIRRQVVKNGDFKNPTRITLEGMRASEMLQPEEETSLLSIFGQSDRLIIDDTSVVGSVPQVFALMNGDTTKMLANRSSSFIQSLAALDSVKDKVNGAFLTLLNRYPNEKELKIGTKLIHDFDDDGIADLAWALINTPEFLFIQ